ncbi:substrate-binding domain-containing protein [Desulfovibrio sp. TomC]|uniref:substrate-binding domain-containing protein n=1 Tax=Desulfovibrio sp. TomC TaxID=1562888 RepID=UPI0005757619|nr:substrate-binding domain-containing protein [Desulfovibrio sp. TomC]KHK03791.1 Phosphate ABC transporter, periplasmic phosphate-binding protein PstS [Desulfovibrio sp. TomC]
MAAGLFTRLALAAIATALLGLPALAAPILAAAETTTLSIPGTGDSQDLLRILAQRFMRDNPDIQVEVPDSVGTTGGIRSVLAGKAELARTARPLRADEIAEGLTETVFANVPVVFAVHPSVTEVAGLTSDQVLAVFSGNAKDWSALGGPSLPIARVCRETPETARVIINAALPGFDATGCQDQAIAYTTPEAVNLATGHPGTIGYFSLPAIAATPLVPLALNGVVPSLENIGRKAYTLTIPFALVYKPPLSPAAARFLKALGSPDALSLMTRLGCLPVLGKSAAP